MHQETDHDSSRYKEEAQQSVTRGEHTHSPRERQADDALKAHDQLAGAPFPTEHEKAPDEIQHAHDTHDNQHLNEKQMDGEADEELPQQDQVRAPTQEELKKGPPGGYDATPIPHRPAGYTVKFTVHKAINLPISDIATMSCDPYCRLELKTGLPTRHKEDPPLMFRTRTIWRKTEPEWEQSWIVANVPASGFRMKIRVYDEDSNDKDDRLGNAHISASNLHGGWKGIEYQPHKIMKRAGSWRAYALRGLAVCFRRTSGMHGEVYLSAECLGRTPGDDGGRAYTIGLQYWCKNYSPLLGRLAGSKEPDDAEYRRQHNQDHDRMTGEETSKEGNDATSPTEDGDPAQKKQTDKKGRQRFNFQSNQMQLQGPVPPELYHRYVEFKPFVKSMFTGSGLRGIILNKAIHAQHTKVYNFNKDTRYGVFENPCSELTLKFLDLAHFDQGGRIYTYVITLDGLMRFTETGKEFSIDLLSKHTMHSDGSIYIAFSGEFFVRRSRSKTGSGKPSDTQNTETPATKHEPSQNPSDYELIIDNDSGTYRPNAKLLPLLRQFMQHNLPGLKIVTLDCQNDEELMKRLKEERRERKKTDGNGMVFTQVSRSSSLSSSDDERLDELANRQTQDDSNRQPPHRLQEALGMSLSLVSHLIEASADLANRAFCQRPRESKEDVEDGLGFT